MTYHGAEWARWPAAIPKSRELRERKLEVVRAEPEQLTEEEARRRIAEQKARDFWLGQLV
jgi:hypothetical protein